MPSKLILIRLATELHMILPSAYPNMRCMRLRVLVNLEPYLLALFCKIALDEIW